MIDISLVVALDLLSMDRLAVDFPAMLPYPFQMNSFGLISEPLPGMQQKFERNQKKQKQKQQ